MKTEDYIQREHTLMNILRGMSETMFDEEMIKSTAITLRHFYESGEFRHRYSALLLLVKELDEDPKYTLDCLNDNLQQIAQFIEVDPNYNGYVSTSLFKLSDHLNLEIVRLQTGRLTEDKLIDAQKELQLTQRKLNEAENKMSEAVKKADSLQTDVITVLSIFSAIVIAFFGGINYISSAMTSMLTVHIFKVILVCLVCGFVLLNMVFLLLYFVGKITQRNIYARCESENCTCKEGNKPKCSAISRLKKRLPYVFWINMTIVFFAVADILCWLYNFYHGGECLY